MHQPIDQHQYTADRVCLDCCVPEFLADGMSCPVTDPITIKIILQWWPHYDKGKQTVDDLKRGLVSML
jgi:hypothetical protein